MLYLDTSRLMAWASKTHFGGLLRCRGHEPDGDLRLLRIVGKNGGHVALFGFPKSEDYFNLWIHEQRRFDETDKIAAEVRRLQKAVSVAYAQRRVHPLGAGLGRHIQ